MIAAALALGSSLAWGTSDFLAGTRTRWMAVLAVLLLSQGTCALIVLALTAIDGAPPPAGGHLLFAALAGVTDGAMLFCLYRAMAAADGGALWAVLVDRLAAVALLAGAAAHMRVRIRAGRRDMTALAAIGALDVVAQLLFAVALTRGHVGVVAALGTLYPVMTVLLAGTLLRERPDRIQRIGVGACLAGVMMLSV